MSNDTVLFTPFISATNHLRAHMQLSLIDRAKFDGLSRHSKEIITVTDEVSGKTVKVQRADCGAGCRCAAVIVDDVTFAPKNDYIIEIQKEMLYARLTSAEYTLIDTILTDRFRNKFSHRIELQSPPELADFQKAVGFLRDMGVQI